MLTKSDYLPTLEELEVEECPLGSPYLKAGAFHLGKHCEATNNEFMLCRQEHNDPRTCLAEGKEVTRCSNNFFRMVKQSCAAEFTQYAMCLEKSSGNLSLLKCRNTQASFDKCMKDKNNMDRPHYGYHSLAKVHQTDRPKVEDKRPAWLDDPRGEGRRPDVLPSDYPRNKFYGTHATGGVFSF